MPNTMPGTGPNDDLPWNLERLGRALTAMLQAQDAAAQTAEAHTQFLRQILLSAQAPGESSEFSPLNRNLKLIARLLETNGTLLDVICRQVGGSLPEKP